MMSAAVIAEKVIWKATKTSSGMASPGVGVAQADAPSIPARPTFDSPPTSAFPSAKARE